MRGGRQGGRGRKGTARGGGQKAGATSQGHAAMAEGKAQALPPRPPLPPHIAINAVAKPRQLQSDDLAHPHRAPVSQSMGRPHGALDRRSPSPQPGQVEGPSPAGTQAPGMLPSHPAARPVDPRMKPRVPTAVPRPAIIPGPAGSALTTGHADRPAALQTDPPSHSGHGLASALRPAASPGPATASAPEKDARDVIRLANAATSAQHDSAFLHALLPAQGPRDPRRAQAPGCAAMQQLPLTGHEPAQQGLHGEGPGPAQSPSHGHPSEGQHPTHAAYMPDASGWIRPPSPLRTTLPAKQLPASANQQAGLPPQTSHGVHLSGLGQPQHTGAWLEAMSADHCQPPGNGLETGEIRVEGPTGPRIPGSLQDGWIRPPFHSRPMPPWPSGPGKGAPQQTSGQPLAPDQPHGQHHHQQQQQHVHRLSPNDQQAQSQERHPQMQPALHHQGQQHLVHPQQTTTGYAAGSAGHLGQSQASSSQQGTCQPASQQHSAMQQQEQRVRPKRLPAPIPRPALHGPGRP